MIAVRFACGHQTTVGATASAVPVCACGETQIRRVAARAPRFSGACVGPYAETRPVTPATVALASAGPLRLKE